ncbi:MAG: Nif3-like dinuclear metal center hexameric protein [Ferruginibacter sp.]|nr:Nif3-like dinuclear metal center hexameric protein [Ferruginibacter sp.]
MLIREIIAPLEKFAPPALQEDYDNTGLICGNSSWECSGVLLCLDSTEDVISEAKEKNCNLVIAHHPIVFRGLKKITGKNYVEQTIINAIKNDVAIYAIHTNLDNVIGGVSGKMADKLGLINRSILAPKTNLLRKLSVFVPVDYQQTLMDALFTAGAGAIGDYSDCSFSTTGNGTFKAGPGTNPFIGKINERHTEQEVRVEVIFPHWQEAGIIRAMKANHPYEVVAHDIYALTNLFQETGAGIIGELSESQPAEQFLQTLKNTFNIPVIKHSRMLNTAIRKVALCGGAGNFLTGAAIGAGADIYITADLKYHEFFDADGKLLLADIGHYESEQFSIDLLFDILSNKFPNFAVLKTGVHTNPVQYFKG